MAKKDNTVLYVAIGAAVVGYLLFRQGGILNKTTTLSNAGSAALQGGPAALPISNIASGLASELPTSADQIGVMPQPAIDPTGMQINFV